MKTELVPKASVRVALDRILSSAVVLHWDALAHGSPSGTLRIEYHLGPDGSLDHLKLWARAQEYWTLICDYSPNVGWSDGPRFTNGYHSRPLGRLLQSIMMNQNLFQHDCRPNSNATLEIGTPTIEDIEYATQRVTEAFPTPVQAPRRGSLVAKFAAS